MNKKINILHLEDDPFDSELIESEMRTGGIDFDYTQVDTKVSFIDAIKNEKFDLILADYKLPTFNGSEALKLAQEICPDIPFIIISGTLGDDIAVEMVKNGATDYVLKQRLLRLVPVIERAILESEEKLKRKNAENLIRQSLRDKEILLKEIHHRVKNNLQIISSIIKLQASYSTDPHTKDICKDLQTRVMAMALIHQKLYQTESLSKIDFKDYLQKLVFQLVNVYRLSEQQIFVNLNLENLELDVDTAVPCGMLISEIVSNSLKHAFPNGNNGEISIKVDKQESYYMLNVKDNGIGLPNDKDLTSAHSLGMQLIKSLTAQLAGTLNIKTNHGTEYNIKFFDSAYQKRM
ncbi:MAG: response regulator [Ignavibacteriae bacterium]|nr:MAG: response regulator [Ignavibacteriota bacterium]